MRKHAATPEEILRWLVGSALVGATARTGLAAVNQEFGKTNPLKSTSDLYDPSIEVPIEMSPKQYERYMALRGTKQAMWDNAVAAGTVAGGGALGWYIASKLIRKAREAKLDRELQKARDDLTALTLADVRPQGAAKTAAWDFLEIAAEQYRRAHEHQKAAAWRTVEATIRPLQQKHAGRAQKALGAIQSALKRTGGAVKDFAADNPAAALAVGGTAGLAGLGSLPVVRNAINPVGSGVTGAAGDVAKAVASPLGYGAAAVLGPIAMLSLLYGVSKGYDQVSASNKRKAELDALRRKIREEEAKETPYFQLVPYVRQSAGGTPTKKGTPAEAVGSRYTDADKD